MPVTLLVIIYHNLVLWLCSLPPLGCHSKPQHLGKLLQESIQVLPILWNLPRCSSSTLVYIYGTHTVYWTIIFLSKCHLQEEEVDVSKPSRSDFNIFVSTTNSKCWQYLLLKNKKQKKNSLWILGDVSTSCIRNTGFLSSLSFYVWHHRVIDS